MVLNDLLQRIINIISHLIVVECVADCKSVSILSFFMSLCFHGSSFFRVFLIFCFRLMELEMAVQELCQSRNQVARLESEMNQLVEDPTSMAFRLKMCCMSFFQFVDMHK